MKSSKATLLLGTNLGDKAKNLKQAIKELQQELRIVKQGTVAKTEPVGFTTTNDFCNQLIWVETKKSPMELLEFVKSVEKQMGRTYGTPKLGERYTDRIIDIDILFYDTVVYESKRLIIPHPQVKARDFVIKMLAEA